MTADTPFISSTTPVTGDSKEVGVKRDRYGRYLIPKFERFEIKSDGETEKIVAVLSPDSNGEAPWTRATTFAKSISDTFTLSAWSQRMVAKGLAIRPDLIALAAATPVDDKQTLDTLVEDAKAAAGAKVSANLGTAMHAFTEALDRGEEPVIPIHLQDDAKAYSDLIKAHGIEIDPWLMEKRIVVPDIDTADVAGVAGTFDRIVKYKGKWTVLDLKTGRDLSYGWNEIAIQLALYANAAAIWDDGRFHPMPEDIDKVTALVVHLPVGKGEATLYEVSLTDAWQAVQLCAAVRKWRKTRKLARAVAVTDQVVSKSDETAIVDFLAAQPGIIMIPSNVIPGVEPANDNVFDRPALDDWQDSAAKTAGEPTPAMVPATRVKPELAPLAGPGKRGCGACGRTGHKRNSPKCLGENDPAKGTMIRESAMVVQASTDEADALEKAHAPHLSCSHTNGWSRNPVTGDWECPDCGHVSDHNDEAKTVRAVAEKSARPDPATVETMVNYASQLRKIGETLHEIKTAPVEVQPSEPIPDPFAAPVAPVRKPTWEERIDQASSRGELQDLFREGQVSGVWTQALTDRGLARLAKISEPAG